MGSFTFFDYSGLNQDEAASIKLFLEFASYEEGIILEPKFSLPNPSNESNDKDNNATKPILFGDDITTIENTFELLNLPQPSMDSLDENLSAQINNILPLNDNMKNEISLEPSVSSESLSPKNNISSWSGLFQSNKSNHHNSNVEIIKNYSEIDKEFFKDDKDYPTLENLITTSEHNVRKMPFTIIPINEDPLSPTIKNVLGNWPNFYERLSLRYIPRPLINEGNWCYANSVLQALLCLPPFYSLFSRLGTAITTNNPTNNSPQKSSAPVTMAFSQFVYHNYVVANKQALKIAQPSNPPNSASMLKTNQTLNVAPAVKPSEIYDILPMCISSDFSGKQEDAEELLSSVLNAMHEEMSRALTNQVTAVHVIDHVMVGTEEGEEWEKVGRKGKSTLTRETKIPKSPISAMFGGILRSNVQHPCCKGSANLQPFFVLPLDIQPGHVRNLNDALRHTFAKEHLPDYYCPKTKNSIDAYRILQIETVPEILVFQIKSFVFNSHDGTSKKLLKSLIFPQTLDLNKEILSRPSSQQLTRYYQLRSVIYHVGKSIQGGHYVTSFKQNDNDPDDWYLADDAKISRVKLDEITSTFLANKEIFKPVHKPGPSNQNNVTPYLLFYTKCGEIEGKKGKITKHN